MDILTEFILQYLSNNRWVIIKWDDIYITLRKSGRDDFTINLPIDSTYVDFIHRIRECVVDIRKIERQERLNKEKIVVMRTN